MRIAVIDGQGGGLGKSIISTLKHELADKIFIYALGFNGHASKIMLKAGANQDFHGEKALINFLVNCTDDYDCIIGPIGLLCPGGIKGEVTSEIASIIFSANCPKYLVPLKMHGIYIPGTGDMDIKSLIDTIINELKSTILF